MDFGSGSKKEAELGPRYNMKRVLIERQNWNKYILKKTKNTAGN